MTDDSARSEMLAIEDSDAEKEVDAEEMASDEQEMTETPPSNSAEEPAKVLESPKNAEDRHGPVEWAEEVARASEMSSRARVHSRPNTERGRRESITQSSLNRSVSPLMSSSTIGLHNSSLNSSSYIMPTPPGPYLQSGVRGGRIATGKPKSDVDWKIYRAKQIPGPGEYDSPTDKLSGGRFSMSSPKSDVEWVMLRASKIPGPGEYESKVALPSGGRFSTAKPKTDIEWKMLRASQVSDVCLFFGSPLLKLPVINYSVKKIGDSIVFDLQVPGPGEYAVKIQKTIGAKMSVSPIVTDVDLAMRRASKIPGPGAYDDLYGKKMSGGRFSTAKPKSDVDWIMYRSARIPGPGEYEIKSPTPSGGRIGTKAPTALDQLIAYNKKLPGPGFYDNDIYSIGKRTGAVPVFSRSVTAPKPATPHSTALYGGIPPEARRKPALKNEESLEPLTNGERPHTSLGLMREREGSQEKLSDNGTVEAETTKKKNSRPWYRKGVSRDDSFRGASPGKWMVPESAQRAYGVWGDDVSTHKKRKGRQKALDNPETSKPFFFPRPRHVTVRMNAGNRDDIEAFFNEDCDASELQAADLRHGHKKGQKLSAEAQKLYDLATQVLGGSCLLVCVRVCACVWRAEWAGRRVFVSCVYAFVFVCADDNTHADIHRKYPRFV